MVQLSSVLSPRFINEARAQVTHEYRPWNTNGSGPEATVGNAGATVAFPRTFSAAGFWPLAHATGATVLYTLGTILAMLLTREPSMLEQTSRLRVILGLGSAPIR